MFEVVKSSDKTSNDSSNLHKNKLKEAHIDDLLKLMDPLQKQELFNKIHSQRLKAFDQRAKENI